MGTRCAISRGRQAPACFEDQRSVWQVFGGFADAWVAAIARNTAVITTGGGPPPPPPQHGAKLPHPTHARLPPPPSPVRATPTPHPPQLREHRAHRPAIT